MLWNKNIFLKLCSYMEKEHMKTNKFKEYENILNPTKIPIINPPQNSIMH